MIINVDEINSITPHLESRAPSSQDISVDMSEDKLRALFYKIWEWVEDDTLNTWLEGEGFELKKKI